MHNQLSQWQSRISTQPIPILTGTVKSLDALLGMRNIQVYDVLCIVEQDPGLAVQVLRSANNKNRKNNKHEVKSIEQAIKVLEIKNIRVLAQTLPTIEKNTSASTRRLLLKTFYKAYHSAKQAEEWARTRNDVLPEEVYCAAFMHFLGEMYIAIHVPNLMTFVSAMQKNTNLVAEEAQYLVLGFTLAEMTIDLADAWSLPSFVKESLHIESVENPRSYGVILAAEFIQSASEGWYSEKTWGLQLAASVWLEITPNDLISNSHKLAATIARKCTLPEIIPLANSLLFRPIEHEYTENKTTKGIIENKQVTVCLTPQHDQYEEVLDRITYYKDNFKNINEVVNATLHGMHDGLGLNRVVFYLLVKDHTTLQNYMSIGIENDPLFNKFKIDLTHKNLFVDILKKEQGIWVNNTNNDKVIKYLPNEFHEMISIETFYIMSIYIENKPVGLFYADRHSRTCGMDQKGYNNFKKIAKQTATALEYFHKCI